MRLCLIAALMLAPTPTLARPAIFGPEAHYYGPLKILFGVGYDEKRQKDGSWRVMAASRRIDGPDFAPAMALQRAAELADLGGHRYIQILGGRVTRGVGIANYGTGTAVLYFRAADDDAPPAQCRDAHPSPHNCMTIAVASVRDKAGPLVGKTVAFAPGFDEAALPAVVAPPPPSPLAARLPVPPAYQAEIAAPADGERVIKHRDPQQGWTISD